MATHFKQSLQGELVARTVDYDNNSEDGSKSENVIVGVRSTLLGLNTVAKSAVCEDGSSSAGISSMKKRFDANVPEALPYREWQGRARYGGRYNMATSVAQEVALLYKSSYYDGEVELHTNLNEMKESLAVAKNDEFEQVNNTIKYHTNGAIDPMVNAEDCSNRITIISQSMLKGQWKDQFEFYKKKPFHITHSKKVPIEYYEAKSYSEMCILKTDKFEAVAIPLAGDDTSAPLVVMIKPLELDQNFNTTTEELYRRVLAVTDNDTLGDVIARILQEGKSPETHYIRTPLFKIESKLRPDRVLMWNKEGRSSEFAELFTSKYAFFRDVEAINPERVDVFSKGSIEFNEDGLVTRCKTSILMCDGAGPKRKGYPVIWFDQPFMLLTIDRGLLDADTNNEIGLNDVVLITNPAAADDNAEDSDSKSVQHQGRNRSSNLKKRYFDSSDNDDYDSCDDDDYKWHYEI